MGHRRSFQARHTLDAMAVPSGNSVLIDSEGCLCLCLFLVSALLDLILCWPGMVLLWCWLKKPASPELLLPPTTQCLPNIMPRFSPQPWRKDSSVVWVLVWCPLSSYPFFRSHASHSLPGTFYFFIFWALSKCRCLFNFYLFTLALLWGMWNLSSLARDRTHFPAVEARSLNH